MNDNKSFHEISSLFRPEMLIGMIPGFAALIFALTVAIREHDQWGIYICSFSLLMLLGIIVLLVVTKLDLVIDNAGITFTYFPNQRTPVHYPWAVIATAQVLTINPIRDFLGWGKKHSRKYGWGYLSRGNHILHVVFKNGDKISFTIINKGKAALSLPADKQV
jgi:hypothetical protein